MFSNGKSRRTGQVRPNRGRFDAMVEVFEKRELLTGIGPFIQGTAFVDTAGTGSLTSGDAPLAGATISLYQGTTVSPSTYLESTTTNANGQYLFYNNGQGNGNGIAAPVAGQTYTVVETAVPSGYASKGTQTISELDPVVGTTSNSITVTVAPSEVQATYNGATSFSNILYFSLNGNQESSFGTSLNFQVSSSSGSVNTASFVSYCVDPTDTLTTPPDTYTAATDPTTSLVNGGEIGYLFNQYGITPPTASSLPSSIQSIQGYTTGDIEAGLQTAIWTLEFPGEFSLENIPGGMTTDYAIVSAIASDFIADAQANPPEQVGILDASLTGSLPNASATAGAQSVLVGESLNFANSQVATGSISGTDLLVSNSNTSANGLTTSTPNNTINGTTVELLNSVGSVIATTTTSGNGAYSFTGLPVGTTYSVVEVPPAGDNHLGQSSSTNGAVTSSGSTVSSISLTSASPTSVDNFFETASVSVNGSDYLVPSTTSLTTSTTGAPLAGTTITLTGTDEFGNAVSKTTTTASNGSYSFTGLNPSTTGYTVTETLPTSYAHLGQTSTLGTVASTPSVNSIVLVSNGSSSTDNFFEYGAQLSGTVYADNNTNDTLDGGDTGIGGVTVYLDSGSSTTPIASTTTASNGTYSFTNLAAGSYLVSEVVPNGYLGETPNVGVSGGTPAFVSKSNLEQISAISLASGTNDTGNNFGQYLAGSLSGVVFVDATNSGSYVGTDATLTGISVSLVNSVGTTIATTQTGSGGAYSFTGLVPGTYTVVEGTVTGYSPDVTNSGSISSIRVTAGANTPNNNFGEIQPGTISGTVYADNNVNDVLDGGDTGLGGVQVYLYNSTGTTRLATTTTASDGTYSFTGVAPGTYIVAEFAPSGYTGETPNPGVSGGTPSYSISSMLATINAINLTSGTNDTGNNFGEIGQSSISGTVYVDATGQGLNSSNQPAGAGDTGEAGVTVILTESNGTKLTTTTASNGTYSFTGLPYGTYGISETIPSGTYQTGPDGVTYTVTTTASSPNSTNDNFSNYMACNMSGLAAYYFTITTPSGASTNVTNLGGNVAPGDTVTAYFNIAPGSAPEMLSLVAYEAPTSSYSPSNAYEQVITSVATGTYGPGSYSETVTIPNSYFQVDFVCGAPLPNLELNNQLVDYQYENRLISAANGGTQAYALSTLSGTVYADNNGNDTFDSGDTGLGGVTLYLYNGSTPIASTTTASNGSYSFANLPLGSYTIDESSVSGYTAEASNVGSNGGTSGIQSLTSITLNSNTNATGYNFGELLPVSSISGTVYNDVNRNDTFDSGDTGLGGVQVYLYNSTGTVQLATTKSAANGTYSFTNLKPGSYIVTELAPSTYTGEIPNAGSAGGTATFTSSSALEEIAAIVLGSGSSGTGYNFPQLGATISGIAYSDATGNGLSSTNDPIAGDTPQAGLTINLYAPGWIFVESTVTAANGSYSFKGLPYGNYAVTESVPSGQIQTGPIMQTTTSRTEPIGDSGFEAVSVGNGSYAYNPTGSAWTFTGLSGVSGNNSAFTSGDGNAPQGNNVAFLQEQGTISQGVSNWTAGSYQISFSAAQRSAYGLNNEDFEVLVDGNVVATFDPKGSAYQTLVTPSFYVSSGSHTITFQGLDSAGGDNTVFLDNVSVFQNMGQALVHTSVDNGYNVNVSAATPASTNNNFSNYTFPNLSGLTNVYYSITTPAGVTTWGSLSTAVEGDTVTAYFTITPGSAPETLSLVAYEAPSSSYSPSTAYEQVITSVATGTYGPGTYSQSVTLPNSYFQVDFVGGAPLTQLELDGSKIDYNYQDRLISAANGGTQAYTLSTISGTVYSDVNRNDTFDSGDTGLGGVQVYLYNSTGTTRLATTTTASNGTYSFSNLPLGTYIVAEFAPSGYTGETPNAGVSGGTPSYSTSSMLATINAINLTSNANDKGNNFGNLPPLTGTACLSGIVYADVNYNDVYNSGIDYGIAGVTVTLSGDTIYGSAYTLTTTTNSNGVYTFTNVVAGDYTITETEPTGYTAEASNVGNAGGVIGLGSTSSVSVTSGATDTGYNFGSKVNSCSLGNYQTCSANWWCGSNGQSLINCMNGSSSSTKLGNWLSSLLPNICGSFAGKTNSQVCSSFQSLCLTNSCDAQIVSTALAAYCTNTSLAGCSTAANYGFGLVTGGSGNCTVNLGSTFASYGGPCNTTSLFQLLSFADSQSTTWNSWSNFGLSSQSAISSWFSSINSCSKIG